MKHTPVEIPFNTSANEPFIVNESTLDFFLDRPQRITNGVIILCRRGQAEVSVNMKKCIMEERMKIIIMPQDLFMVMNKSEDFEVVYFAYSIEMFSEACFRIDSNFFGFIKENFYFSFPPDVYDLYFNYIRLLKDLYQDRGNRSRIKMAINILQNLFLDSFDKICRYHSKIEIKGADRQNKIFKRFIRLVHKYYTEVREVGFYANELSISTRYLTAITQKNSRETPKEFIDNFVIQEIKLMLHSSELSIQEIADRLNFPDQSYLGRFFKNRTGKTPSEYRKRR